ncbi:MAG: flagellar hook-basal body protein [Chloroflexota bacterium]|nr:MAG: flagellar hook-basal body protein [Chloroflexota bacterium]
MIRSVYTAGQSLVANTARQLRLSNNITNVATPGYRQDVTTNGYFDGLLLSAMFPGEGAVREGPIGVLGVQMGVQNGPISLEQGPLQETGNPLDMAIFGDGFFTVQTSTGLEYTRDGRFSRDPNGQLITLDGSQVLGNNGPIMLPTGDVSVTEQGDVMVGDRVIDRLQLASFAPTVELKKVGFNRMQPVDPTATSGVATPRIQAGFVEGSNVDLSQSMVEMMSVYRAYEVASRTVQMLDRTMSLSVQQVGQVR